MSYMTGNHPAYLLIRRPLGDEPPRIVEITEPELEAMKPMASSLRRGDLGALPVGIDPDELLSREEVFPDRFGTEVADGRVLEINLLPGMR